MFDATVFRDAGEYLKVYYSDPDSKCLSILYEFTKGSNNDRTIITIHKRMENGWGQPTSYSYLDLAVLAEKYRNAIQTLPGRPEIS